MYARDTYFAATLFIGTDFMILFLFVPLFIWTYFRNTRSSDNGTKLRMLSLYAVALYYAASLCFGVSYNRYHLLYIVLFAYLRQISIEELSLEVGKGIKAFLLLLGVAVYFNHRLFRNLAPVGK